MAWSQRATNVNNGGAAEVATITAPTATDGDGIVVILRTAAAKTITPPAGFTQVVSGAVSLFYKVAASEGATYSFTWTGQGTTSWAIAATAFFSDAGPTLFDGTPTLATGSAGTSQSIPAQTAANADNYLVAASAASTSGAVSLDWSASGMAEQADWQHTTVQIVSLATVAQPSAGSTGAKAYTASASITPRHGLVIAYVAAVATGQGLLLAQHRNRLVRVP